MSYQLFIHVSGYLSVNHCTEGYVKAGEIHTIEVPYGVTALDVDGDANGVSILDSSEEFISTYHVSVESLRESARALVEEEEELPWGDATDYVADMVDYCMDMEER